MSDTDAPFEVSGLDDVFYDYTLEDESTGAPFTTGTVEVHLCVVGTVTLLHPTAAKQALTHQSAGRWTAVHDDAQIATAIASLAIGQQFDRVLVVPGIAARRRRRCVRVRVVDER